MTEFEQSQLDQLEAIHTRFMIDATPEDEQEHLRIMKMSGMVPWEAMKAYCDNHNTAYPDWPDGSL